jgi:hypothetical protein
MFERKVRDPGNRGVIALHTRIGGAIPPGRTCNRAEHTHELEPVLAQQLKMLDESRAIILVGPDAPEERRAKSQKWPSVVPEHTTCQTNSSARREPTGGSVLDSGRWHVAALDRCNRPQWQYRDCRQQPERQP